MRSKKVCLLGTSNTLKLAPLGDRSFEFWALNDMYDVVPVEMIDRWFDIHGRSTHESHVSRASETRHIDGLRALTMPVYMQERFEDIPASVKYPLEEIIAHFNRQYFKSTLDYMLALALYEGFEEIHIYGVDMAAGSEYSHQKPSLEYWIGRAEGMGVKVVLPAGSDLLKAYFRYGYDEEKEGDLLIKARAKSAELAKNAAEFQKNYYLSLGAKDTWDFVLREFGG
ncbi:MAG: hypothetical protein ACM3PP_06725 [Candidatus Saccharibacteria bacterium]